PVGPGRPSTPLAPERLRGGGRSSPGGPSVAKSVLADGPGPCYAVPGGHSRRSPATGLGYVSPQETGSLVQPPKACGWGAAPRPGGRRGCGPRRARPAPAAPGPAPAPPGAPRPPPARPAPRLVTSTGSGSEDLTGLLRRRMRLLVLLAVLGTAAVFVPFLVV